MIRTAVFSPDRKYRYALWRIWDERKPVCMFTGLNPSTAIENTDDPTIRRGVSFAGSWGYGGFCMANLFAYCSKDPDVLSAGDCIGPDNDAWLVYLAAHSDIVVACWGHWDFPGRAETVRKLIPHLYCFGLTKQGQPKHPLYLPRGTKLRECCHDFETGSLRVLQRASTPSLQPYWPWMSQRRWPELQGLRAVSRSTAYERATDSQRQGCYR
jgi:hypothetical protein